MITPTKRWTLNEIDTPLTEDERYEDCHEEYPENTTWPGRWEATVRWREDDLIIAEAKLSKSIQELHAAKAKIEKLEKQLASAIVGGAV